MPSKKPKTPKSAAAPQPQASRPDVKPTPALASDSSFAPFADLVAASFRAVAQSPHVFATAADPDDLYERYLAAFPEGTNPLVKERTEHDCSTCKQFIRRVGNVVTPAANGDLVTVWDTAAERAQHPYNVVAAKMRDAARSAGIADVFRVSDKEGSFGAQTTRTLDKVSGLVRTHSHLYTGEVPKRLRVASPDQVRGEYRTTVQVFARGLVELLPEAVDTVLALIDANNLYRGEEHRRAVVEFQAAQRAFAAEGGAARESFTWTNATGPAARFRNTVVGTLVQDLSEGKDVDTAVRSFEAKVAPQNYKRTSAVITPTMVKKAMETIAALGLESALERRFAVIGDVSVADMLWVDGAARSLMRGGIGDVLMQHAEAANASRGPDGDEERAESVGIDYFTRVVLPQATSLDVLFKSEHVGNLVALTAPAHPEPKQLFRWPNDFAWSYVGNVADSIRERVKKAGGRVDGATMRVSLSWFNYDDLDLHVHEPQGRGVSSMYDHIFFANRRGWTGGTLDVDMNAGGLRSREPVENVVWTRQVPDGAYRVVVHNYNQRESSDVGFVVEVESGGKLSHFSYNKMLRGQQSVSVATLHVRGGALDRVDVGDPTVTTQSVSQEKWGLRTEQYVKVRLVTLSPNCWGGSAVGNKHTIFILDGCKSDEPTRGIYNEFLHPRLEAHRKVFEVIGDKTKCPPADGALCGLGFSSTKRDSVVARVVAGKKRRLYRVQVGSSV